MVAAMQPSLDAHADEVKKIVAKALVEGKSISEIVELLKTQLGIETNANAVMFFIKQHFGASAGEQTAVEKPKTETYSGKIDVLTEMTMLYFLQKERLAVLRNFEKEVGMPMPEVRENIALLLNILVRIGSMLGVQTVSVEDRKRWLFEDVGKG